jgi:hypothetical protein
MFDQFVAEFKSPPAKADDQAWAEPYLMGIQGYAEFSNRFAGRTFEEGLYRVVDGATGPKMAALIAEAFPDFSARAHPFAYDWLGRQFAVDSGRIDGGQPLVLMLEPGTGEVLEIPMSILAFHEKLGGLREPALAASFFAEWAQSSKGSLPLRLTECVGYRVPLFLGGTDTVDNLEVVDLEVYWSLSGQLRQGTRHLPSGTSIREVSTG